MRETQKQDGPVHPTDLLTYFTSRKSRFTNSKGMELGLTAAGECWTYFVLFRSEQGPLAISISTEEDRPEEFIEGFRLTSLEDIQHLEYTHSWMRYLNGAAEITVTPLELDASLGFKIVKRKTIIFSLDLHFYDEVYEHLTMPEDFERYVSTHDNRLRAAEENRYRVNRK
jgi:hypothetical protein